MSACHPDPSPPKAGGNCGSNQQCTTDCKLVNLTVIHNATRTNVIVAKNWACVKSATDDVIVEATVTPDTDACKQAVAWSGDAGTAVPGHPNQRSFSRSAARHYHVQASLGGVSDTVDIWVVWVDLTITCGTGDTLDAGNDASFVAAGHSWPAIMGGGNNLGAMSSLGTSLTFCFTVGKMQAKGVLAPAGVEDAVSRSAWHLKRKATANSWDNGVVGIAWVDHPDLSHPFALDEDPKSGSSTREIYDIDAPGCSTVLFLAINRTSEVYANFTQWATVTLDAESRCSDEKPWSYKAQVDADLATGQVQFNAVSTSAIAIPAAPHYATR